MDKIPQNINKFLAVLSKLYELAGNREFQELIVNADVRVETWSSDNWNGGTYGFAVYLTLPEALFLRSVPKRANIQDEILQDLENIHNFPNEFIEKVFIEMEDVEDRDWRFESGLLMTASQVVPNDAQRRIWKEGKFRLFLSHKSEFKSETAALKAQLSTFGVSCFVAHEDIHPTEEWVAEIENALTTMDGFAALMTTDFHDSYWTDQEVGFACARGVPRIAVMLGKTPYGFLGKFQGLKTSWENAASDIAGVLIKNDRMFSSYLAELRKCPNWIHANELGALLPKIISLNEQQIDELVTTYNETAELRGAFAFDGTKPKVYGLGIVSHLNRLGSRKYKFATGNKVERYL
ncbi:MAG: toll/interleukin-1 receptor domain-containing protein [Pyrinomonadaceae bacterium]